MLKCCNETGSDMWKSETQCTETSGKQKSFLISLKVLQRMVSEDLIGWFFFSNGTAFLDKHLDQMIYIYIFNLCQPTSVTHDHFYTCLCRKPPHMGRVKLSNPQKSRHDSSRRQSAPPAGQRPHFNNSCRKHLLALAAPCRSIAGLHYPCRTSECCAAMQPPEGVNEAPWLKVGQPIL